MARDLIVFNPEEQVMTIRHIQAILVRDLLYIAHNITLEPILEHFNNDNSHMGIITKVVEEEGKDPVYRKIGIITREDIVEEMLMEEIEDEVEAEELIEERQKNKRKLFRLFSDYEAGKILTRGELFAVIAYLASEIEPFKEQKIQRDILK